MKRQLFFFMLLFITASFWPCSAFSVEVGDSAPEFEGESTMGTIRLKDYLGKKYVLLAFYHQDFTSD